MRSDVPAEGRLGFVRLVTFGAGVWFFTGVSQHVSLEVVLTSTGMRTEGALEWLHPLVDPDVLLELGVCSDEHFVTIRTLVASTTYMYKQKLEQITVYLKQYYQV